MDDGDAENDKIMTADVSNEGSTESGAHYWPHVTAHLPALVTIISVPRSLNSSHSAFISRLAFTDMSFGCSGFLWSPSVATE